MNNQSIVLIGFMGVGKTTIGKELAKKLQWTFVDIDEEIEKVFKLKTVDIFRVHGEERFREMEKQIILQLATKKSHVISVGGGAFKQQAIKEACFKQTTVIFLDLAWDDWKKRIPKLIDTRPILQGKTLTEMKALYDERQAIYAENHLHIQLKGRDATVIADEVRKRLEQTEKISR